MMRMGNWFFDKSSYEGINIKMTIFEGPRKIFCLYISSNRTVNQHWSVDVIALRRNRLLPHKELGKMNL